MIDGEELRKKLVDMGFEKVYIIEDESVCTIYMVIYQNKEFVAAVFKGITSLYAKIFPATSVLATYWHCNYIKYVPMGWYVFSDNLDGLAKRLSEKIIRIAKVMQN